LIFDTRGAVLTLMLGYRKFKETNTGPNPNPNPDRYRRHCPDPSDYGTFGLSSSHPFHNQWTCLSRQ